MEQLPLGHLLIQCCQQPQSRRRRRQRCQWLTSNTIFVIFILFLTTNCILVSGQNVTFSLSQSQYFLDDNLCDSYMENRENETERCDMIKGNFYCFGDLDFSKMNISINKRKTVEVLYICGFMKIAFDANSLLKNFSKLKYLKIAESNFTHINNDFPNLPHVEVINITHTLLAYTRPSLFEKLKSLKELDLRSNQLDHMEGPLNIHNTSTFQGMYLSDNKWNCTRNMKWLLDFEGQKVADKEFMKCVDLKYTGRPLLRIMEYKKMIRAECQKQPDLRNCSCFVSFVHPGPNRELVPLHTINCSSRAFHHLPAFMPQNVTTLHIANNEIRSLEALVTPVYRNIHDLYIDYNRIKSIDILEGATWLRTFRVLSLRGNKLTKLSMIVLDHGIETNENQHALKLYLSNNPWRCDCIFTPHFQDLLIKYKDQVKDATNITCKYLEGDKNFGLSVITLNRGDVCVTSHHSHFLNPIDMLNIVLASLIVFIFVKLGYDYYHYKKYSKLPWFVTKLP